MSARERRSEIINMLIQRGGFVRLSEIVETFGVSNETVRRDLELLQDQKRILRIYGGAILLDNSQPTARTLFSAPRAQGNREREVIGRAAASLVQENETLLLSSGTTVLEVAKNLKHLKHISVLTNSIEVVHELAETNFDVYVLGGKLNHNEMDTAGEMGLTCLNRFYVDRIFLGAGGVTKDYGISDFNAGDFSLRSEMMKRAREIVVVAQSDKFGRNALFIRNPLDTVDIIVTDENLPVEYASEIQNMGIKLVLAKL